MRDTPFKLRQRRVVAQNVHFEVLFDDVVGTSGSIISDYLVVSPKVRTGDLVTGVAVLPVVDGKLGLLRIYRHAVQRYLWEIPRGFVDLGEADRHSARRELEEETGLSCIDGDLLAIGTIAPEPGILAARVQLFAALHCHPVRPFQTGEFGHVDFRLFDSEQVSAMFREGEIQDATTLITCLIYREKATE